MTIASSKVTIVSPVSHRRTRAVDRKTLAKDLSAHLVFGVATAAAFGVLDRKESQ
jgi:hypothetical protein